MPTDMYALNTESGMPSYGVWDDEPCLIGLLNVHRTSTGLGVVNGGLGMRSLIRRSVDDQKAFQPTSKPWTAVGKVETATDACTGVLVGPRLMVTSQ